MFYRINANAPISSVFVFDGCAVVSAPVAAYAAGLVDSCFVDMSTTRSLQVQFLSDKQKSVEEVRRNFHGYISVPSTALIVCDDYNDFRSHLWMKYIVSSPIASVIQSKCIGGRNADLHVPWSIRSPEIKRDHKKHAHATLQERNYEADDDRVKRRQFVCIDFGEDIPSSSALVMIFPLPLSNNCL